ncbi:MAG: undecaprenyl-diphosphate phosphatase, partial [Thermotogaceae bacterium]|nr:undecaprenyl-diphosphate phosphatase [Thermotogaceae bacterium]
MEAFIQGLVQGLTEFLPVSSSGHLVFLSKVFGFRGDLPYVAMLHLGTFFAVLIFTFQRLLYVLKRWRLVLMLLISTIPAAIVGVFFENYIEGVFDHSVLPLSFSLTALFLLFASVFNGRKSIDDLSWWDALMVGIAQAIAIVPGLSRSGLTIATAIMIGYKKEDALYYSFLMSLPVTFGAGVLNFEGAGASGFIGFVFSFIFGLLALFLLKKIVLMNKLHFFGYYLLVISMVSY